VLEGVVRRWAFETIPDDGSIVIGCTRVDGIEYRIRYDAADPVAPWVDVDTGRHLSGDIFVGWREDVGLTQLRRGGKA
jgi:hypothetical protein